MLVHAPITTAFHSRKGFTLLEMMVVMVIIGTILGLAVLSLPADDEDGALGEEARRLEQLLRLARDEAMVRGTLLGLRVERDGYRFLELRESEWQELSTDAVLRPRELPEDLRLTLEVEGRGVDDGTGDRGRDDAEPPRPQVFITSSGEITGFELVVSALGRGREFLLRGSPSGHLELVAPDAG